jgi:hypothetical protein
MSLTVGRPVVRQRTGIAVRRRIEFYFEVAQGVSGGREARTPGVFDGART